MANEIEADVKSRYRAWRLRIFAITWMSYAGFYLTRKSFSVAKIKLLPDDDEAARNEMLGQFALVDGAYLSAYALGQFVWGMSGDRFGTRRVIEGVDRRRRRFARRAVLETDTQVDQRRVVGCQRIGHSTPDSGWIFEGT